MNQAGSRKCDVAWWYKGIDSTIAVRLAAAVDLHLAGCPYLLRPLEALSDNRLRLFDGESQSAFALLSQIIFDGHHQMVLFVPLKSLLCAHLLHLQQILLCIKAPWAKYASSSSGQTTDQGPAIVLEVLYLYKNAVFSAIPSIEHSKRLFQHIQWLCKFW